MSSFKILLTGASGFIGGALLRRLLELPDTRVGVAGRTILAELPSVAEQFLIEGLSVETNWLQELASVKVIIHCAARVHLMQEQTADPYIEFRRVNVDGTLALARQAAIAGVQRFVFISSIKVNGEVSEPGMPFSADAVPSPQDAYGISKYEAEQGLLALAAETGMEVVIIRPVLVYGPGVKANFRSMMSWLYRGAPLPLGSVHNQRSLVALDNLVDLVVTCIDHPAAANQVFLASDGEDISTTDLLRKMGTELGKPARLLSVPVWALGFGARLIGKQGLAHRLCGSLQVDISKTRELLGWTPPVSMDEGLRKTALDFLEHQVK